MTLAANALSVSLPEDADGDMVGSMLAEKEKHRAAELYSCCYVCAQDHKCIDGRRGLYALKMVSLMISE